MPGWLGEEPDPRANVKIVYAQTVLGYLAGEDRSADGRGPWHQRDQAANRNRFQCRSPAVRPFRLRSGSYQVSATVGGRDSNDFEATSAILKAMLSWLMANSSTKSGNWLGLTLAAPQTDANDRHFIDAGAQRPWQLIPVHRQVTLMWKWYYT
jgi:hypothetical protein